MTVRETINSTEIGPKASDLGLYSWPGLMAVESKALLLLFS